ncbi:hypothetical protein MMC22_007214 [Lobaria immixta]|nr:hypothetical protein [Lobaria immixta]
MENINPDTGKLLPTTPPNSRVQSTASDDGFVTAPSSPVTATSPRVNSPSPVISELSLSTPLTGSSLCNCGLHPSQEVSEQTPPPSPTMYLEDEELFLPSLPPHLLVPPGRSTDAFAEDDPREPPRPRGSASLVDAAHSFSLLSISTQTAEHESSSSESTPRTAANTHPATVTLRDSLDREPACTRQMEEQDRVHGRLSSSHRSCPACGEDIRVRPARATE